MFSNNQLYGANEQMYDIAMRFEEELLHNEYEAVVAVHTDRDHLYAYIVLNSVIWLIDINFKTIIGTGRKFYNLLPIGFVRSMDLILCLQNIEKAQRICPDLNGKERSPIQH